MNNSNYYNIVPGGNFKIMLAHFKAQAGGGEPCLYVKTPGRCYRGQAGFRYVSLASKKSEGDMPKMTVTDPNEAINKRAESQLKQDLSDKADDMTTPVQSVSRPRKRKTASKQTSIAARSKIVKRAKDLFDN